MKIKVQSFLALLVCCLVACSPFQAGAQERKFQLADLETMYANGLERQNAKDFAAAGTIFKQLLKLEPNNYWTKAGLAYNYLSLGQNDASASMYEEIKGSTLAGDYVFQLMAEAYLQLGQFKKALHAVEEGLGRFPNSGNLFFEQGKVLEAKEELAPALQSYFKGINVCPGNDINFKAAFSLLYTNNSGNIWCPLLGEMYLATVHEPLVEEDSIKGLVYKAWGGYFISLGDDKINLGNNLEGRLNKLFITLTPIVSDGMSAENLLMAHMRLITSGATIADKGAITKWFDWQEKIVRDGYFDIYQQWMFGSAESRNQFNAWSEFHKGAIEKWLVYFKDHHFTPDTEFGKLFLENIDCKALLPTKKKR